MSWSIQLIQCREYRFAVKVSTCNNLPSKKIHTTRLHFTIYTYDLLLAGRRLPHCFYMHCINWLCAQQQATNIQVYYRCPTGARRYTGGHPSKRHSKSADGGVQSRCVKYSGSHGLTHAGSGTSPNIAACHHPQIHCAAVQGASQNTLCCRRAPPNPLQQASSSSRSLAAVHRAKEQVPLEVCAYLLLFEVVERGPGQMPVL